MIALAELIDTFGKDLEARYADRLLPGHRRALAAIALCTSEHGPQAAAQCPDCGQQEDFALSCGHRSCPRCQHGAGQAWLERQRAKRLPCDYFLVTFTVPYQLRALIWRHQREGYDLLMKLAWQTLAAFGLTDKALQGKLGATAVLHTHTRALDYHPHVHILVPAGAVDDRHRLWRRKQGEYLFRTQNLAQVFRAKWFEAMAERGWTVKQTLPKDWVVDCQHVGNGDQALTYLGKYLYRGVLREHDILGCEHGQVTFGYRDNSGARKTRTLEGADFLWLLLRHVLPKGLRRTRDYGFLHPNSKRLIQLVQWLFRLRAPQPSDTERPGRCCKHCGATLKVRLVRRYPRARKPPLDAAPNLEAAMG